ncbi:MAG: glycosyltransferase family 4 protein, partial [Verrucomicrobiota bacterium]
MSWLVSFLVSFALGFVIYRLLHSFKVLDVPNDRSSHSVTVVRGGGVAVLLAGVVTFLLFAANPIGLVPFLIPLALIASISFADDVRSLPARLRLAVHAGTALICLGMLSELRTLPIVILPFFFLWIVSYTNSFNFMDGVNGLAAGQATVTGLFSALFLFQHPETSSWAYFALAISGAAAGFLPHNFPQARMFLGDVGSIPLGFIFATIVAIAFPVAGWKTGFALFFLQANFWLDAGVTIARRIAKGELRNLHQAHREHFYQRWIR